MYSRVDVKKSSKITDGVELVAAALDQKGVLSGFSGYLRGHVACTEDAHAFGGTLGSVWFVVPDRLSGKTDRSR